MHKPLRTQRHLLCLLTTSFSYEYILRIAEYDVGTAIISVLGIRDNQ